MNRSSEPTLHVENSSKTLAQKPWRDRSSSMDRCAGCPNAKTLSCRRFELARPGFRSAHDLGRPCEGLRRRPLSDVSQNGGREMPIRWPKELGLGSHPVRGPRPSLVGFRFAIPTHRPSAEVLPLCRCCCRSCGKRIGDKTSLAEGFSRSKALKDVHLNRRGSDSNGFGSVRCSFLDDTATRERRAPIKDSVCSCIQLFDVFSVFVLLTFGLLKGKKGGCRPCPALTLPGRRGVRLRCPPRSTRSTRSRGPSPLHACAIHILSWSDSPLAANESQKTAQGPRKNPKKSNSQCNSLDFGDHTSLSHAWKSRHLAARGSRAQNTIAPARCTTTLGRSNGPAE